MNSLRLSRAFVLYANKAYIHTVQACVRSIKTFSEIPVIVYIINCDDQIEGATTVNWQCDVPDIPNQKDYIDRKDPAIYRMMIERPMIVKDALLTYANEVCYVDADSVATPYINNIFNYHPQNIECPYFVEGIYEYFMVDGRGAPIDGDLSNTLEAPACDLFSINQYARKRYRQTGYFIATITCIKFLNEWYVMCTHPTVLANNALYAPYNEETLANVLLWKHNFQIGLPYIYCNGTLPRLKEIIADKYEWGKVHADWFRLPDRKEDLLFIHGEKNADVMNQMIDIQFHVVPEKQETYHPRIMFLAPHLSTGGMPAFLLKRIEALKQHTDAEIFVVEYTCYSLEFIIQRSAIMKLVGENFTTLYEDKMELVRYIYQFKPDIIHVDEMVEGFDSFNQMPEELMKVLYAPNRIWRMVETCHNITFNPDTQKIYQPDAYAFCTPYHLETFKNMTSVKKVIEFPIDNKKPTLAKKITAARTLGFDPLKKHVLNVGLWTRGKNQGEGLEIARKYPDIQFHFVGNQAGNFADYWKPLMNDLPDNVKIWGERTDVSLFLSAADLFMFNSTFECNPLVLREAISYNLPIIAINLPQYGDMFNGFINPIDSNLNDESIWEAKYDVPKDNDSVDFANDHYDLYNEICGATVTPATPLAESLVTSRHYVGGPFFRIDKGTPGVQYDITFSDEKGKVIHHQKGIAGTWINLNRKWFTRWKTVVSLEGKVLYDETLDFTNKRIFIVLSSEALGDSIAWIPYCQAFKEKHNCEVIVSTFHNKLFKNVYPELIFAEPGETVKDVHAQYFIASHGEFDPNTAPQNSIGIPLQKAASNILGLEFEEIRPRVSYTEMKRMYKMKYVAIATNSTTGCKFWQKADWQKVIDFLVQNGYQVINISKERNDFDHCTQILNDSMNNTMNILSHAEFYIGLSSGLSWLAWAMNKEVVMISNFTSREYEFDCIRIANENVCHACFNNPKFKFDRGDYDWCPIHKGDPDQWICQKSISGEMVIEEIKPLII